MAGKPLALTKTGYKILACLMREAPKVVPQKKNWKRKSGETTRQTVMPCVRIFMLCDKPSDKSQIVPHAAHRARCGGTDW